MDKGIIMEVPELLIDVMSQELWATTIARTIIVANAVNLFVGEEAGKFFEEVLHIHPTCYSMYTICILDV